VPAGEAAIVSAAHAIGRASRPRTILGERIHVGDGKGQLQLRVHSDISEVLYALGNLGLAMDHTAQTALAAHVPAWAEAVRVFTPSGPPRRLPPRLMPHVAPRVPSAPHSSQGISVWGGNMAAAKAVGEKALHADGRSHPAAEARFNKVGRLLAEGQRGVDLPTWSKPPSDPEANLRASINYRIDKPSRRAGFIQAEVYSDNYYAGFVDQGFDHGLEPVWRITGPNNRKVRPLPKWIELYANIDPEQLGDYAFTHLETDSRFGDEGSVAGFTWDTFTQMLGWGGGSAVTFMERHHSLRQPGVHFFEKGTAAWLSATVPKWRNEVNRIMQRSFDEGLHWLPQEKQQRVRAGMGRASGRFATNRLS
jgi:hypothetical protein